MDAASFPVDLSQGLALQSLACVQNYFPRLRFAPEARRLPEYSCVALVFLFRRGAAFPKRTGFCVKLYR